MADLQHSTGLQSRQHTWKLPGPVGKVPVLWTSTCRLIPQPLFLLSHLMLRILVVKLGCVKKGCGMSLQGGNVNVH